MTEILEWVKGVLTNPFVLLFGTFTIFEIAPIKIHPWKWVGNLVFGGIRKDLARLEKELIDTKVQNWRWNVLDFANSCRNGRRHSKDEWSHVISQLAEYENYIERNGIVNGVFEEDARYLREEYHEHCKLNDFL